MIDPEALGRLTGWIVIGLIAWFIHKKIKRKEKTQKFLEKNSKEYREANFERRKQLLMKEMEKGL